MVLAEKYRLAGQPFTTKDAESSHFGLESHSDSGILQVKLRRNFREVEKSGNTLIRITEFVYISEHVTYTENYNIAV